MRGSCHCSACHPCIPIRVIRVPIDQTADSTSAIALRAVIGPVRREASASLGLPGSTALMLG